VATAEATLRASILRAIRQRYQRRHGVIVFGRPASAATGPGHPDLFGVVRGFFLALEIKTRTGKPTPLQVQRIQELREAGAYAWVVRSPAEGLAALRWILEGGKSPMSDEPIDLSAWLNEAPLTDTEQGAAAAVASVTDADAAQALETFETMAQEAGGADDLLSDFPAAISAPVENGTVDYVPEPLPEFEDLAQPASTVIASEEVFPPEGERYGETAGMTREEKLQALDARDDALDAQSLGDDPADESHNTRLFHSMLRNDIQGTRNDVRAVGDRVTLVFETINRLETDVAAFGKMFRSLLKALEVDESELPEIPPAEPKRTRRAKKAE